MLTAPLDTVSPQFMHPDTCLRLGLTFEARQPIRNLPPFQGALWTALLRNLLRPYLPPDLSLAASGIMPVCRQNPPALQAGDRLAVELVAPAAWLPPLMLMLWDFNQQRTRGRLRPGDGLYLTAIHCAVSGTLIGTFDGGAPILHSEDVQALMPNRLTDDVRTLLAQPALTLIFETPLRLTRPAGTKSPGHHYCDADFFFGSLGPRGLAHLAANVRHLSGDAPENDAACATSVRGGHLDWLDMGYSRNPPITLGGVMGHLQFEGISDPSLALRLVWGQFTGSGKNGAFGLGFYRIMELGGSCNDRTLKQVNCEPH